MLNKKVEINLGGEVVQLWFNNYAVFEMQSMFGVEQTEITKLVSERIKENYLLLAADLIKIGIKGHSLAKGINTPSIINEVNELVATADINELMRVWEVFFDSIGGNVKEEKKNQDETPKIKEQKPEPLTKMS